MKLLNTYIGTTIAASTGIVTLVLLALFLFSNFVAELDDVGQGGYGVIEAAQYTLLTMPRLTYQLFPIIALLGTIIGLGVLANNSELTAMRAAGVSLLQLVKAVMAVGLVLMMVAAAIGEAVAPAAERLAQDLRFSAIAGNNTLKARQGLWARDGRKFIYLENVLQDGSLANISIYVFTKQLQLEQMTHAVRALYRDNQWELQDVVHSNVSSKGVTVRRAKSEPWQSPLSPDFIQMVAVKPEFLTAWGLYRYINYLKDNGLNAESYEQAFWRKIVAPLSTGVMVFLAIPFVLGPLRSVPIGQRILAGVLIGIGFYLFNQVFGYVGLVYGINVILSVIFPTLLFLAIAISLSRNIR